MTRSSTLATGPLILFAMSGAAFSQQGEAIVVDEPFPVEYVRVCDVYGIGYYYIPSTETCVNVDTGETRVETEQGTVVGQTKLAKRVEKLEEALKRAEETLRKIGKIE